MVDPETLARIKVTDPHPELRAYAIGHEGESNFKMLDQGIGDKTFTWVKRAVGWLHEAIKTGTKVFNNHGAGTNEHTGRIPIGEIVGKAIKNVKDKVTTVAAFYIYPEFQALPLDVASIEADITYETDDGGQSFPTSVQNVTGIALGNGEVDSPGFPGASILGSVAAFHGNVQFNEGNKTMNLAEIKTAVQEGGHSPSKLFSKDQIIADSVVVEHVKEEKHNLYEQNQRQTTEITTLKEGDVKKDNAHANEIKTLKSESLRGRASVVLDKILTDRKYTEQQMKFAQSHVSRFTSEATDDTGLEEDLKKFADSEMKELEETSVILGVKKADPDPGKLEPKPDDNGINVQIADEDNDDVNTINTIVVPDDKNPLIPGSPAFLELDKTG